MKAFIAQNKYKTLKNEKDQDMKKTLTINGKQNYLGESIGITTIKDWQLLTDDEGLAQEIVGRLNEELENAIIRVKEEPAITKGEIGILFGEAMKTVCDEVITGDNTYGLHDSEAHVALARYIALNYDISMYDYGRWEIEW